MRGLGIACRPSVSPSVTLVICDHIGWKSWKLIARTISPTPSLYSQKAIHLLPGKHGKIWGETRGGVGEKWHAGEQNGNISETRKDRGKVTMDDQYKLTNALSDGTIPDPLWPPLS